MTAKSPSFTTILIDKYDQGRLDLSGVTLRNLVLMQARFTSGHRPKDADTIQAEVHARKKFTGRLV